MGFSRQEYWSGLPFPSPGDLPDTWIELESPVLQADSFPSEPPGALLSLKEMEKRSPGGAPSINLSVNSRIQPAGLAGPIPIPAACGRELPHPEGFHSNQDKKLSS